MTFRSRSCWVLLAVLCCANLAAAQAGKGRIEGGVTKEGEAVVGVLAQVFELQKVAVSDTEGKFVFEDVPPGTYTLVFTLGNNRATRENVIVLDGKTHQLDLEVDWDLVYEKVKVTAGAARAAKIVDAPAAVTSIPEEQIEREAAHGQVPKILEFTPGAEVTQSGLYDFNFNTRGFNSSLNRRVSTYIDGRDVGVVLLGAQEWAAVSGGLEDLQSLEFIRGPSAALYGANASSGVINITTKAPRDSMGSMVRITGGLMNTLDADPVSRTAVNDEQSDFALDFRTAGAMGQGWYYKVTAGMRNSGDYTVSRDPDVVLLPEYSGFCSLIGETDCLPEEKTLFREQDNEIRFGSVRVDKYLGDDSVLTFEAGKSDIEGPVFQTGIGRVQALNAERPFFRFNYSNPRWNVLGHYTEREGDQANLTEALVIGFELISDTKRYGAEAQGNWSFWGDKGRFVIGAAHTEERVDTANPATGLQTVVYVPIETDRQAVFSQFDYKINDHFKLVFAGRVDKNTLHDTQFSPKAAVVYSITPKHSIRATFNKAFQVANYSEFFLHTRISRFPIGGFAATICGSPALPVPVNCGITEGFIPILAVGNDDLQLEKTSAWEIGYSGLLANRAFVTVDYYNSENKNFISDLVPQVGTSLGNCDPADPIQDRTTCPINNDYGPWVSTDEAENTFFFPGLSVAQALRNAVNNTIGGGSLGFRLATDLDGSTVVVGRTYTNVGKVDTQGVDFGLQLFLNDSWSVQASYSWFDFDILDDNADASDVLLPNSPEHKASVSVSFRKNRWAANLSARWVHGFRWSAGVFQGPVADYGTEDLSVSYRASDLVSLAFNAANLRDNVHRQTFGGDLLQRRALMNVKLMW